MKNSTWKLRRLCVMAMLCAMAFAAVALIRIPVVLFLKYEPKDVLLTIGGFLFGPMAGAAMATAVALVELSISDTGLIGLVMNILSSCLFVCTASAIYCRKRTLARALIGLICGAITATAGMLLWNYLITPLYMEATRQQIAGMLLPVFLPFNLLKSGLNAALTMLLYKAASSALRAARLLPPAERAVEENKRHIPVWPFALLTVLILVVLLLLLGGR